MHALIATYPREEGPERAGALSGEKATVIRQPQIASDFFAHFDLDGDGLISYEEYLLVMSFLAILPEVRASCKGPVLVSHLWPSCPCCCKGPRGVFCQAACLVAQCSNWKNKGCPFACEQDVATVFAVLDENANSMISKEEFAAVTGALRRRLRRVSHLQRTGLDTSSGRCLPSPTLQLR